jgi:hypothetical protein
MGRQDPSLKKGVGQDGRYPANAAGFDLDVGIYQSGVIAT